MSDLINKWHISEKVVVDTEYWNNLPNGNNYQGSKFNISIGHCTPPVFVRAGQQVCGGDNYWKTEKAFGVAVLEYLKDDWNNHYPKILGYLKKKRDLDLMACQSFVDQMQKIINESKQGSRDEY
jgi:hypothetical protein